jgi:tryptophanyl-tRNA synthetase
LASQKQQEQLDRLNKLKEERTQAKIEAVLSDPKHLLKITTKGGKPKAKPISEIAKLDHRTVSKYLKKRGSEGWGGEKDMLEKAKSNFIEKEHNPPKEETVEEKVKKVLRAPKYLKKIEDTEGNPIASEIASILHEEKESVSQVLKKMKCKGWGGQRDCLQPSRTQIKWRNKRKEGRK